MSIRSLVQGSIEAGRCRVLDAGARRAIPCQDGDAFGRNLQNASRRLLGETKPDKQRPGVADAIAELRLFALRVDQRRPFVRVKVKGLGETIAEIAECQGLPAAQLTEQSRSDRVRGGNGYAVNPPSRLAAAATRAPLDLAVDRCCPIPPQRTGGTRRSH